MFQVLARYADGLELRWLFAEFAPANAKFAELKTAADAWLLLELTARRV